MPRLARQRRRTANRSRLSSWLSAIHDSDVKISVNIGVLQFCSHLSKEHLCRFVGPLSNCQNMAHLRELEKPTRPA
jgi:hypothetical protein